MTNALTSETMSPELLKVVERAQREPEGRFHALAHLIDVSALERAYRRIRKDAAVGVDGVTKEQYGQALPGNLKGLLARMKAKQYRHQPVRRVHIPKEKGKTRPIGISTVEDRQNRPRGAARSGGGNLRAGFSDLLARLSTRTQCPRRDTCP